VPSISKEDLLELFVGACRRAGVTVSEGERVDAVVRIERKFGAR
jgi:hypothetical protein